MNRFRRGRTPLVMVAALSAAVLAACGGGDGGSGGGGKEEDKLVITSWGGSWLEAEQEFLFEPFTKETGIEVEVITDPSSPMVPAMLQAQQGDVKIDIVETENAFLLQEKGYLMEFPDSLKEKFAETMNPDMFTDFHVISGQSTVLLVCNPDVMQKCPTTAAEFWDIENFPGERAISNLPYLAAGFAQAADGVPPSEINPLDLDNAFSKLEEIREDIAVWPSSGEEIARILRSGEVGAGFLWLSRAVEVMEDSQPNMQLSWDGAVISTGDGSAIMKDAPHPENAIKYYEWLADHPEQQAKWTEATGYPTPAINLPDLVDPGIKELLPASHTNTIYQLDSEYLAGNNDELQTRWQEFLAGATGVE